MSGPVPEFSRVFPIEPDMGAGKDAKTFTIEATAEERAALAGRFGLLALDHLAATGTIDVYGRGRRARLTATLTARAIQACVVTLQPVPAEIEETFTVSYRRELVRPSSRPSDLEEEVLTLDLEDPPDPLPEAGIDVGEAVAEHFGLALDPYPRAPGAALPEARDRAEEGGDSPGRSPFGALKGLQGGGRGPKSGK